MKNETFGFSSNTQDDCYDHVGMERKLYLHCLVFVLFIYCKHLYVMH